MICKDTVGFVMAVAAKGSTCVVPEDLKRLVP